MYTKNERKLMKAMMRRMKKKELIMAIEGLLDANENQSKTIHALISENNKLRESETEVDVPKVVAGIEFKRKD